MRIYLAAATTCNAYRTKTKWLGELKPKYFLNTFFEGEKACAGVLQAAGNENFLLDSGAFSYMSGADCDKEQLRRYTDRYIDFINKHDVKYFFELDVDTIFGIEFVEELRREIEGRTNKKSIPVWHKGRGVDYWKWMCDNYDYVAIGGLVFHVKQSEYPLIRKMVAYARKRGVKVHGLGFTKTKDLPSYMFYSVDSTSWNSSAALGQQLQIFDGTKIVGRNVPKGNKMVNLENLRLHNFAEWVKYQHYMDTKGW